MIARKRQRLNQQQMGERLGISPHTLSKWERDLSEPRLSDAVRWAEITQVPLDWLATGHNPRHDQDQRGYT